MVMGDGSESYLHLSTSPKRNLYAQAEEGVYGTFLSAIPTENIRFSLDIENRNVPYR